MDRDSEYESFEKHIRLRHAIACCEMLFPIIKKIEASPSSVTTTVRQDTKGVLRGRLDIPRYVGRRASSLSWPKTYPILVTSDSPSTPENALVVRVLRTLLQRMSTRDIPVNSAEAELARRYKRWILGRTRRDPWVDVAAVSSLARLHNEASRRIARRQTGNEYAYAALVDFMKDSRLVGEAPAGTASSERFVESLLAFPAKDYFLDRIYEIWCVRCIAEAFMMIGAKLIEGPVPMTNSRDQPIYTVCLDGNTIEVWFQKSLPRTDADWCYEPDGNALVGIPDICLIANNSYRLIVDAKNRLVKGRTRSEETYKMLGYFENFKAVLSNNANWGVLAFLSYQGFSRTLFSRNDRRLELISAHPVHAEECTFLRDIIPILEAWIDRVARSASDLPRGDR